MSDTPSQVIYDRANHQNPNMGLQTWSNDNIRKSDVTVSKNYLAGAELRELNSLTTILLDVFDLQLEAGRLVYMEDAAKLLDRQLNGLDFLVLNHSGTMSKKLADKHAHVEYSKYKEQQKALRHEAADKAISEISKEARELTKKS